MILGDVAPLLAAQGCGDISPIPNATLPSGLSKWGSKAILFVASFNDIHGLERRQKHSSTTRAACILLCAGTHLKGCRSHGESHHVVPGRSLMGSGQKHLHNT